MAHLSAVPTRPGTSQKRLGLAAMCLAMLCLPLGDAISKTLTGYATPFEVTVWRTLAQAVFFVPTAFILRRHLRGNVFSLASLLSAGLIIVAIMSLVTAFKTMPIATAIAIFFVEPLLLTLLAGPFLGEVPGRRRYIAVGIGLIGALIVIRPNFITFGPVVLLPLLAALTYALNMIVLRSATRSRSALSFQFGASLMAAGIVLVAHPVVGLAGAELAGVSALPGWGLWAIAGAGALATVTFLMISFAFSKVEASLLAPFQYLEIVGATAVGFLFFSEIPDGMTFFGTAIILASGGYVFHRERVRNIDGPAARPAER